MVFSKTSVYGLRAMVYLALHSQRQFVPIREISDTLVISFHFLTKILQILTKNGLIISYKGPKDGVRLIRETEKISVLDIILILEGPQLFDQCILGLPVCDQKIPCPMHNLWQQQRERLKQEFSFLTLDKMAGRIKSDGLRLSE